MDQSGRLEPGGFPASIQVRLRLFAILRAVIR
jgi:hypothetical protein